MAPRDRLGCAAGGPLVVARSAAAVIGLQAVFAYPEGCELQLRAIVRRAEGQSEEDWWRLHHTFLGPPPRHPGSIPETMLRTGVQFADGRRATNTFRPYLPGTPDRPPAEPVLTDGHGGTSSGDDEISIEKTLWLWPLPPAEPFHLVVQWPAAGIALTRAELDGAAIVSAAADSVPLWD